MKERLKQFLDYQGIKVRQFETLLGTTESRISKFMSNHCTSLKSDTLVRMVEVFPQLSIEWLLTGKGEMIKSDNVSIPIVRSSKTLNKNINLEEKKYSVSNVIRMIKNGEIALSVDTIKGVNGATYVRTPDHEERDEYNGYNTLFTLEGNQYSIPTVVVDGTEWYLFSAILRMLNLLNENNDVSGICANIPYQYKRLYTFKGHGYRRVYVRIEALELFGISSNKQIIAKKKVNLYMTGITTFHINLAYLQQNAKRIMDKLPNIEDKIFMGEVYRILSQLE